MNRIFALFAGSGFFVFGLGAASAASPEYCTSFAKQYEEQAVTVVEGSLSADHVRERLYHKCLNMDDDPVLPTAYAETLADDVGGSPVGDAGSTDSMLEDAAAETPTVDATAIDETIVKRTAAIEADRRPARRTGRWSGSGYATGSAEWRNWCAEHFPNSFDPQSGTIVPLKTGTREPCL